MSVARAPRQRHDTQNGPSARDGHNASREDTRRRQRARRRPGRYARFAASNRRPRFDPNSTRTAVEPVRFPLSCTTKPVRRRRGRNNQFVMAATSAVSSSAGPQKARPRWTIALLQLKEPLNKMVIRERLRTNPRGATEVEGVVTPAFGRAARVRGGTQEGNSVHISNALPKQRRIGDIRPRAACPYGESSELAFRSLRPRQVGRKRSDFRASNRASSLPLPGPNGVGFGCSQGAPDHGETRAE